MRYTRAQLEELLWRQLTHIDEQNAQVTLLREQNTLLKLENENLRARLDLIEPAPKPYPKPKRKKLKRMAQPVLRGAGKILAFWRGANKA